MTQDDKTKFKRANDYNHLGVVVLGFENREINGVKQMYAVGFDLDNPKQPVAVALMQEDGLRKNIAQVYFGVTEQTNGSEKAYVNTKTKQTMTKEDYDKFVSSNENVNAELSKLLHSKKSADNIATKKTRINQLPAVLMFDNANQLGQVSDIKVYEARWIGGISGNASRKDHDLTQDDKNERDFSVAHRKILGHIKVKYNDAGQPNWADCHAIDRIIDLKIPPKTTMEEFKDGMYRNRDVLRYALSNETKTTVPTENGEPKLYAVERKPFTYFNMVDQTGKVAKTVNLISEEYADSRTNEGDPVLKLNFKRPKDAVDTIEAYMAQQDRLSLPLQELLATKQPLTIESKQAINNAQRSDEVRAVISGLLGTPFSPLVTKELAERADSPEMQKHISIKSNESLSLHRKIETGELEPRMINGTIIPLGQKYLERFIREVGTSQDNQRPIRGAFEFEKNDSYKNGEKITPYTQDRGMIFTQMYICPKPFETQSDKPSVFTGLVTIPEQSMKQVQKNRLVHTQLSERHAPTASSFRLIASEYADYDPKTGTKEIPSLNKAITAEQERTKSITNEVDSKNAYDNLYRIHGIHYPNGELEPKQAKSNSSDNERTYKTEVSNNTGMSMGG